MISYWLLSYSQAGLIPPPNADDRRAFTSSERILMDFQKLKRMNAQDIKDLIQDVLHNDNFDSDEVDHNMHDRLMRAVADELEIHNMWQEGDGEQDVRFFKRNLEAVLRELVADERLEGCQHFAFKEYKNANGDRILGGHANGSV